MRMLRLALVAALFSLVAPLFFATSASGAVLADETQDPEPTSEPVEEPSDMAGDEPSATDEPTGAPAPDAAPSATEDAGATPTDGASTRSTQRRRWAPANGAIFSNPTTRNGRAILARILRAVRETNRGEFVRIATWNYADRASTDTLIAAKKRGVKVQVITAGSTDSGPWRRLMGFLNRNRSDKNWAMKCRGACRSNGYAMHMKFAIFSKVNWKRNVSMVGSWNLTKAAGNRQWNDNVTQSKAGLYDDLRKTFGQMKRDRNFPPHPTIYKRGRHQLSLWPHYNGNLIARDLRRIGCWSNGRRTVVRIAVASWWDSYGQTIADIIRRKWNSGCNIRILITDAGGGIMRTLRAPGGRGPIPVKRLTICCSSEGVPTKYLHIKAFAIDGRYGSNETAKVMLNGSPNWSTVASKADEMTLRIMNAGGMVNKYIKNINGWFNGAVAHSRSGDRQAPRLSKRDDLPDWFELY